MKNKAVKLGAAFMLSWLVMLNISIFTTQVQQQKQTSSDVEFIVHTAQDPNAFVSVWNTSKTSVGSSNSSQVRLPLEATGTYDFKVDWGDESNNTVTIWNHANVTHTYTTEGVYTINITGIIVGWRFNNGEDRLKILEIQQWGNLRSGNSANYFYSWID